jgi:hypothetical protein
MWGFSSLDTSSCLLVSILLESGNSFAEKRKLQIQDLEMVEMHVHVLG